MPETEITLERIALIRRLVVAWNPEAHGAPMIHPDAPYGSTDRDGDIANVTGDDEGRRRSTARSAPRSRPSCGTRP
ncbi:hypothetical protein [Methylobacterium gregans]|uniref:hypothetical protein n=1 Tax=Methylobacterium gregans TaxID=374424 RepID=UPI003605ED46